MLAPADSGLAVKLANKTPIPITEVGEITLRVRVDSQDPVHLGIRRIFLVENSGVSDLCVGRETLFKMGDIPEQALSKLAPWERNLLAPYMNTQQN
eukprot:snap_masked-scaffold_16-processed-gene-6.60-mRNA-1 protein AED:1.00 eAED:1.00 QI:0/-1/0/0/-1/1/1/0/95